MISRFFSWFRKEKQRNSWHVTLYTRKACCLCSDALKVLQAEQSPRGIQLTIIDIDTDPDLAQRYGTAIPVVLVNGKERFRGMVNPVLLRRLLDAG